VADRHPIPGNGFHLVPGKRPPGELQMLRTSFEFALNASRAAGEMPLLFAIFNAEGELALVCELPGLLQASEFASLIARIGYERRDPPPRTRSVTLDFAYYPGAGLEQVTTRGGELR
jgi:hypothetical protein